MTAPGMRAKVARNAKPVTRRKYFPNLLIFDSLFFFRLKLEFVTQRTCAHGGVHGWVPSNGKVQNWSLAVECRALPLPMRGVESGSGFTTTADQSGVRDD